MLRQAARSFSPNKAYMDANVRWLAELPDSYLDLLAAFLNKVEEFG